MSNYFAFLKKKPTEQNHFSCFTLVWSDVWTVWSAQLVVDLPSYEPRHSGDWLVYWTVGTWTAASRKNKNLFTIITPLIPHTGEYVNADAASSVKMCFFWWTIHNDLEVNREHEKKGEQECANWRLSVVMDGSHIIGGSGLLWGLRSFKYSVHRAPQLLSQWPL